MARDWQGRRLVPGVNVDRIDISAGDDEARRLGFDAKERMVITYALARWARGEEQGAEQTLRSHGLLQVTPWRMILAAARAAAEQAARQQQAAAHSTYMGSRSVRQANGSYSAMPFARCHCGWEGPGRLSRSAAVDDGIAHLTEGERG